MSRNNRSFYLYFIVIVGLLLFTVWIGTLQVQHNGYTRGQFEKQLENKLHGGRDYFYKYDRAANQRKRGDENCDSVHTESFQGNIDCVK